MTITFTNAADIAVGSAPRSVTTADVNGDGKTDLLVANANSGTVSVRLGNGDGSFTNAADVNVGAGTDPISVTTADVNGDGKTDLLVANPNSGTVSVRLGNGNGSFIDAADVSVGDRPFSVTTADVNGDGMADLLVANNESNSVSVRLGNGNGSFTNAPDVTLSANPFFAAYPTSVTTADVNGDGKIDLLVANSERNSVSVRLGNGDGSFTNAADVNVGAGTDPISVTTADVNRDGKVDLLVANYNSGTVSVRLGTGTGSFTNAADVAVGFRPYSVTTADMNRDGKADLLVANPESDTVSVRLGNGDGSFTSAADIAVGDGPQSVTAADVNGDGRTDLLVANYNSNTVSVRLGGEGVAATQILTSTSHAGPQKAGDTITFTLATETPVTATGNPLLTLSNGAVATYSGLDGQNRPQFTYTVAAGQDTSDLAVTGLALNGGTLGIPGQTSFGTATSVAVGIFPISVITADVNGDGRTDLLVANSESDTVSVRLGNGDGSFTDAADVGVGAHPQSVTTADVNGDGKADLLVANSDSNSVSVRLGTGTGSFTNAADVATGSTPYSVVTSDVNGDGKTDLLIANYNSGINGTVSVRLGSGTGSFTAAADVTVGYNPYSVVTADVNGDGRTDLLVANFSSDTVSVRLGTGTGSFTNAADLFVGGGPVSVTTADVNGDGFADLLVVNLYGHSVSVRLGNGDGSFTAAADVATGYSPSSATAADVNGDGRIDLLVANSFSDTVSVQLGNGDGSFTYTADILTGSSPFSVTTADVNRDGFADLLVANLSSNTVSVILNSSTRAASVDPASLITAPGGQTTIDVDTIAPAVPSVTFPANGAATRDNTPTFFGSAEAGSLVTVSVDGSVIGSTIANGSGEWSLAAPAMLGEGAHSVQAMAEDAAGHTSALSSATTLTVDTLAPDTTILVAPDAVTRATSASFAFIGSDPGGSGIGYFEASLDGGNWAVVASPLELSGLGEGDHLLCIRAVDAAGNTDGSEATHSWTIDAAPSISGTQTAQATNETVPLALFQSVTIAETQAAQALTVTVSLDDAAKGSLTPASLLASGFIAQGNGVYDFTGTAGQATAAIRQLAFDPAEDRVAAGLSETTQFTITVDDGVGSPVSDTATSVTSTAQPEVTQILASQAGPLALGESVTFTLVTDAPVGVGGAPQLTLSNGAVASYVGTDVQGRPQFLYTVAAGQDTSDLAVTGLTLDGVTVGDGPVAVATADLNGDGNIDLLTANTNGNTVSVRLGAGDGSFTDAPDVSTGTHPFSVTTADVNGDGRADLLVANIDSDTVSVRLGNGDGTFTSTADVVTSNRPVSVTTADVNEDGLIDLLVASSNGNSVSVRLGNGDGTFTSLVDVAAGFSPNSVTTADLNQDGHIDMLVANINGGSVSVRLGNGDGTFTNAANVGTAGTNYSLTTADVNGDSLTDLLIPNFYANSVSVRLGNGDGTFSNAADILTGTYPISVTAADMNGDGNTDVLVANFGSDTVSVRLGNGDGSFTRATDITTGNFPFSVTKADVDGDGLADLLVANSGSDTVSVILNSSTGPVPLDPNSVATAIGHDTGISVDTVAPSLTAALALDSGAVGDALTNDGTLAISAEAGALLSYKLDGASTFSASYDPALLEDGLHSVVVRATDLAGNVTDRTVAFTLDTEAPSLTLVTASGPGVIAGTGTLTVGQTATLTLTFSAAISLVNLGTLTLSLSDGSTAVFDAGASDATHLVFRHGVQEDQISADLAITAINLGGTVVQDAAGNVVGLDGAVTNPAGTLRIDGYTGDAGNNIFHGTSGAETFTGRGGDDTYAVNQAGDRVIEVAGEGTDIVVASTSYVLQAGQSIETLQLSSGTGSTALNLTGNEIANTLRGNAGANVLNGGGNDTLAGGTDTLIGGYGNDTYVTDGGDTISELANQGTDTVQSSVTYLLGANLENLTLIGAAAINGSGNTLNNTITGNSAANTLDGGTGIDTLVGGDGNDTYVTDGGDTITEAANQGTDTVQSSVTITLGANLENLTLTGAAAINGTGNTLNNIITGNSATNALDGGGGNDTLDGGTGTDTLTGGTGNDTYYTDGDDTLVEGYNAGIDSVFSSGTYVLAYGLDNLTLTGNGNFNASGNALNNIITGNSGNNTLAGGSGSDTLIGGAGNDIYQTDQAGDLVIEAVGGGYDTVVALGNYGLSAGQEVEVIQLSSSTGSSNFNLSGNEFANTLRGSSGNNQLDGKAGADSMYGSFGNDIYIVDNAGDLVFEDANRGTDTIVSTASYTLAAAQHIEALQLNSSTGTTALNLTGNELAQTIRGNAGANVIDGKAGTDTLYGNAGADTFVFSTTTGSGNIDTIADFNVVDDTMHLSRSIFANLSTGALSADAFKDITPGTGGTLDASDRILYDRRTGALSYDVDGSGAGTAVQFAILSTKPTTLSAADFFVIA